MDIQVDKDTVINIVKSGEQIRMEIIRHNRLTGEFCTAYMSKDVTQKVASLLGFLSDPAIPDMGR